MHYLEPFHGTWVVRKKFDADFMFGPFSNEGDAHFIVEMLNSEKITVNEGEWYGKESVEESHSIY